jgi:uncharacterized protein (TIGR02145 family)
MKNLFLFTVIVIMTLHINAQTVTDIDSNVYNTVTIGSQVWMAENLRTTRFSNGDIIKTTATPHQNIMSEIEPKYQWPYEGNETYVAACGRLYNWYTVIDSRNLCPANWHVPAEAEWTILSVYLGGRSIAGGKLKEEGTAHWNPPNSCANNESGFTARPGGYRYTNYFGQLHEVGYWWSSTIKGYDTYYFGTYYYDCELTPYKRDVYYQNYAYSVRCVKDINTSIPISTNTEESFFYPNPANQKLYLKNILSLNAYVTIYDLQGKQVMNRKITSNYIDISTLSKGIYLVKIIDSEKILLDKLIKE